MKVFWCIISTVLIFGAFQTVAIASDVQIGITVPEGRVTVERGPWFVGADLSVGKSFQTIVHTSVAIGRTIVRGSFIYTFGVFHRLDWFVDGSETLNHLGIFGLIRYKGWKYEDLKIEPSLWIIDDRFELRVQPSVGFNVSF